MAKKPKPERAQYPPLVRYLQDLGCEKQHVWMAGQGRAIQLDVHDPQYRTPDVVSAQRVGDGWRTHIIEAKRDVGAGAAVQWGIAQLKAVRRYADYLYLSLDALDWAGRTERQREALKEQLAQDGFGLLSVAKKVEEVLRPQENIAVSAEMREDLISEWLKVDLTRSVRCIDSLPRGDAIAAAKHVAFVAAALDSLRPVFKKAFSTARMPREKNSYELGAWMLGPYPYVGVYSGVETNDVWTEGDPFGYYAQDGVPAIWVWVPKPKKQPETTNVVESILWHYYGEAKSGRSELVPWTTAAVADLNRRGFDADVCVGTRIQLAGKAMDDIDAECRRILMVIKSKAFKKY